MAARLLRFVPTGNRALADRNFSSYAWWEQAQKRGFDTLMHIESGPKFRVYKRLSDDSYLSKVRPGRANRDKPSLGVRVIKPKFSTVSEWCRAVC